MCELSDIVVCDIIFTCIVISSLFFFFKQKTAYEMRISDWSSDVCSSDLIVNTFKDKLSVRWRLGSWRSHDVPWCAHLQCFRCQELRDIVEHRSYCPAEWPRMG